MKFIINRLVDSVISQAMKTPYFHLDGYMLRWWLVPYKNDRPGCGKVSLFRRPIAWLLQLLNIYVRIHQILQSDDSRAFHDHPWRFITIILREGYTEVRPIYKSGIYQGYTKKKYKAGSVLFRRANDWHRLELNNNRPAWTLFISFKREQDWGFLIEPSYKIHHHDYE